MVQKALQFLYVYLLFAERMWTKKMVPVKDVIYGSWLSCCRDEYCIEERRSFLKAAYFIFVIFNCLLHFFLLPFSS